MLSSMRAIVLAALVSCAPRVPEPQPPRLVCNGVAYPAGAVVAMNSTCYDVPADPCWDDDSEECDVEAEQRREANRDADRRDRIGLALLGAVVVGALIAVAVSQ